MDQAGRSFIIMLLFVCGAILYMAPLWLVGNALEDALGVVPSTLVLAMTGLALMGIALWLQ